ncbi:unnamed protein product, partial [Aphanomyces euteiches]
MSASANTLPLVEPGETSPKQRGYTTVLLWKNFLIKKKHPIKWALEILIPVILIVLMGAMKTITHDVDVPEGWSNNDVVTKGDKNGTSYSLFAVQPSSSGVATPRFYQTEGTVSGLLLQMAVKSWSERKQAASLTSDQNTTCLAATFAGNVSSDENSPYAWPQTCRDFIIPRKLAIIPDNDFTRQYFLQTLSLWYPRVPLTSNQSLVIPSIADSVQFFADDASLDSYITGGEYGKGFTSPTIDAAIVFTKTPSTLGSVGDIEYSLRLNSTVGNQGSTGDVPRTNLKAFQITQRNLDTESYTRYAQTGFMTYQTLVTRFALCVPDWNPQTKTITGNCTQEKSVMTSSATSDLALVTAQVSNDLNLMSAAAQYTRLTKHAFNLTAVPSTSPLRQMPQPVGGAAIFPFPIQSYPASKFFDSVKSTFGLVFVISYLHALSSVLVALISEKETKAREMMKIFGPIMVSWLITYGLMFVVAAVFQAIVAKVMLFKNSSVVLLFVFFLLFGWSVLSFGYMISAIFSKSRTGTYVGMIGFFVMYLSTAIFTDTSKASSKMMVCIFSPVAMTFGVQTLVQAEADGVGITFGNLSDEINNFKFLTALTMLGFDCLYYMLHGLYFERVLPQDYGVPEK